MTTIKYANKENEIHNQSGNQCKGSNKLGQAGLTPSELLEASLGLCVSLTLTHLLERDGLLKDDDKIDINVKAHKDENGANKFSKFDIEVKFPEHLDGDYKKKALLIMERGCTIGNTLKNASVIESVEVK